MLFSKTVKRCLKIIKSDNFKTPFLAFYVFPKIENPEEFVKKSAENGVITVPGAAFGQNGKNHVRMSYANSYENIVKAMDILEKGVN